MGGARQAGTRGVELGLLGPIEASRGGRPLELGGPKPRALLAVLALDLGHVVSVDHIVEALWPGEAPDTAGHAVQVYVSQLRKLLGRVIATRQPGYVLELDPERVDVNRFARLAEEGRSALVVGAPEAAESALREALALWRGPPLADFRYEPFAQTEIARLEELRFVVLEERIDADLALGRHAELVSELEGLVQAQPLRERPRAQLMLALYRSGRQADALAAYRATRETLVDELGIEPGPELKELEAAILRQDASLLLAEGGAARPAMQFRRLAAILFCDVVDSLAIAEMLDPEALATLQRQYFETVSAAITHHGGTVERYAGDAVMAAFGVPVSHEDDALRAARAAFDVQAGLAALNDHLQRDLGVSLEVRIAIAAGEVVSTSGEGGQRFVAGDPVGIAARLQHEAAPGEIVVGEVVARLIDHAARLERRGALEIPGRSDPFAVFRLVEVGRVAPAFEQRLDADLVGRKRELATLRKALKRAVDLGEAQVALVVGPPGVGKSRLAGELVRRTRGVTTLLGRCLSYGEGITYWPLHEVLEQSRAGPERDGVLAALEADPPPPASEISLLFRELCEAQARVRPLVLVLDDLQWAEPTFLELVEQLVERAHAPILVVCLARDELLEERPTFLEDREDAERIELGALSAEEASALVEGLGGDVLESDQRYRIVDAADGNPFFVEQLLALAFEGGLAQGALPETVQALLAARLDRLGPGERAVLERGAVIGREFRLDDMTALLEPEAAVTVDAHVQSLTARGFLRPVGEEASAFRHVLAQEAVYRAAPKRLRAELHERFVDRFEERRAAAGDVDEFAGYHLEQAHRLRTELGESDRRTAQLAEDAGRRLGAAGLRAFKRGDIHAAVGLLARAAGLLPRDAVERGDLLCEYAVALESAQNSEQSIHVLTALVEGTRERSDARIKARARIELENIRTHRGETADELLLALSEGIPVFEHVRDHRSLGRALLLSGWIRGGHRGDHSAWEEAATDALFHYRAAGWPVASCLGSIGSALYWGPAQVDLAISRIRILLDEVATDIAGAAYLRSFLGGLLAQTGAFDEARTLVTSARAALEELGLRAASVTYCIGLLGDIELLAGDEQAAEGYLRECCDELERNRNLGELASTASDLAEALLRLGRAEEAETWIEVALRYAASDDVHAQMMWRPVRARILAARGQINEAVQLAGEAAELSRSTDWSNGRARVGADFGRVLLAAGRTDEADAAFAGAVERYERKGNVVAAAQLRDEIERLAVG